MRVKGTRPTPLLPRSSLDSPLWSTWASIARRSCDSPRSVRSRLTLLPIFSSRWGDKLVLIVSTLRVGRCTSDRSWDAPNSLQYLMLLRRPREVQINACSARWQSRPQGRAMRTFCSASQGRRRRAAPEIASLTPPHLLAGRRAEAPRLFGPHPVVFAFLGTRVTTEVCSSQRVIGRLVHLTPSLAGTLFSPSESGEARASR
jgi:hypothetical protein